MNRSMYPRLDAREGINVKLPDAIVVQFVEPSEEFGNRPCRSDRADLVPHAGETEVDFEQRVLAELPRRGRLPPPLVIMCPPADS